MLITEPFFRIHFLEIITCFHHTIIIRLCLLQLLWSLCMLIKLVRVCVIDVDIGSWKPLNVANWKHRRWLYMEGNTQRVSFRTVSVLWNGTFHKIYFVETVKMIFALFSLTRKVSAPILSQQMLVATTICLHIKLTSLQYSGVSNHQYLECLFKFV